MAETFDAPAPDAPAGGGGGGNALTRKVGPLPLWGWLGVVGATAYVVIKRRKSTTAATPDQVTYAQQAQIPTVGNAAGAGASPIVTGGAAAPTTNDAWRSLAVTTLVAKGYSPLAVDTAMARYLGGIPLDSSQRALIDIALATVGTPPNPPPPAQSAPDTTPSKLPSFIKGSTIAKDSAGRPIALDQAYNGSAADVPSDFVKGVTGLHLDINPDTGAFSGGNLTYNGASYALTPAQVQAYQASHGALVAGAS